MACESFTPSRVSAKVPSGSHSVSVTCCGSGGNQRRRLRRVFLRRAGRLAIHVDDIVLVVHIATSAVGVITRLGADPCGSHKSTEGGIGDGTPTVVGTPVVPAAVVGITANRSVTISPIVVRACVSVSGVHSNLITGRVMVIHPGLLVLGVVDRIADVDVADVDVRRIVATVADFRKIVLAQFGVILADLRQVALTDVGAIILAQVGPPFLTQIWPADALTAATQKVIQLRRGCSASRSCGEIRSIRFAGDVGAVASDLWRVGLARNARPIATQLWRRLVASGWTLKASVRLGSTSADIWPRCPTTLICNVRFGNVRCATAWLADVRLSA